MTYQLRPISEYDLQQIKHINDLVQLSPWSLNDLLTEFDQNNAFSKCACGLDGVVLGYIFVRHVGADIEVVSLGVIPSHQKKGIAKFLLENLLKEKSKDSSIILEVSERNPVAINLYKSFGFQIQGIRQRYYRDDSNAVLMKLNLAKPQ